MIQEIGWFVVAISSLIVTIQRARLRANYWILWSGGLACTGALLGGVGLFQSDPQVRIVFSKLTVAILAVAFLLLIIGLQLPNRHKNNER